MIIVAVTMIVMKRRHDIMKRYYGKIDITTEMMMMMITTMIMVIMITITIAMTITIMIIMMIMTRG